MLTALELRHLARNPDVPKIPKHGCPNNTVSSGGGECSEYMCYNMNCFCEYHCSWRKCRLPEAPRKCTDPGSHQWVWNKEEQFWEVGGISIWFKKCAIPNLYII